MNQPYSQELRRIVLSFCDSIVPGIKPIYVDHAPIKDKPIKECFSIVPEHMGAHGGKQIFGWAIHIHEGICLEAEFHTIWQNPDGKFLDLTPRQNRTTEILFLPDAKTHYKGLAINSITLPLNESPDLRRLIELRDILFLETNKNDLALEQEASHRARIREILNEMDELYSKIKRQQRTIGPTS